MQLAANMSRYERRILRRRIFWGGFWVSIAVLSAMLLAAT